MGAHQRIFSAMIPTPTVASSRMLDTTSLAMPPSRIFEWLAPRADNTRLLKTRQEVGRNPVETNDALRMEIVIGAKLKLPPPFNLDMDDVLHEPPLRQNHIEDRSNGVVLEWHYNETLSWIQGVTSQGLRLAIRWIELGWEDAPRQLALE